MLDHGLGRRRLEKSLSIFQQRIHFSLEERPFSPASLFTGKKHQKKSHIFVSREKKKREKFESNLEWERGAIGGTQTDEAPKINNAPHGLTWHYTVWIEPFMRIFYSEKAIFGKF